MSQKETGDPTTGFALRPAHHKKFKPALVKPIIKQTLEQRLSNQEYRPDDIQNLSKEIADNIRDKVRGLDFERYKILVNCVVGEQRGEGVRVGSNMFWDSDTDSYAEETFTNKHLFAVVAVYGLYQY
eukprot:TRINITY_DN7444_c0_g1_i1.p1 TRINITY_DN7444_c0_g1~~TRINITY_DN7444_c0_g1_i1.p1  ORF type:complete len:127 (-),score=23.85 TRINITY_DN7444_c0_g1_i1:254-634(-)